MPISISIPVDKYFNMTPSILTGRVHKKGPVNPQNTERPYYYSYRMKSEH